MLGQPRLARCVELPHSVGRHDAYIVRGQTHALDSEHPLGPVHAPERNAEARPRDGLVEHIVVTASAGLDQEVGQSGWSAD
jgi:hypothetical protein